MPFVALVALLLASCTQTPSDSRPTRWPSEEATPRGLPTLLPTLPVTTAPPEAATSAPPDTGWMGGADGVELRRLRLPVGESMAEVMIVRLDPAQVRFQVGYRPQQPLALTAWQSTGGALAVINGGFFDEHFQSTALVISAGQASGESYVGRGGMFAADAAGNVSLRALADTPYDLAETLTEAVQSWPMLVKTGGVVAYTFEDGERARRSAVALDRAGRVLLIATSTSSFTLAELAAWLATSDLEIDAALNLDGGSSTGLTLHAGSLRTRVEALAPLPIVLMALPRQ